MRTAFLVDDFGRYKVMVGEYIVQTAAAAYAAGVVDPAILAQIAAYTLGNGAKPFEHGATAHVDTNASGAVVLTFFWSNGTPSETVLKPVKA